MKLSNLKSVAVGLAIMAILSLNFVNPHYVQSYSDDIKGTATKVMTSDISCETGLMTEAAWKRQVAVAVLAGILRGMSMNPTRANTELINNSSGIAKSNILLSKLD